MIFDAFAIFYVSLMIGLGMGFALRNILECFCEWREQRRIDREALGIIKEPKRKLSFKQKLKEFKESFRYHDS